MSAELLRLRWSKKEELPLLERNKMHSTEIPEIFRIKLIEKTCLIKQQRRSWSMEEIRRISQI